MTGFEDSTERFRIGYGREEAERHEQLFRDMIFEYYLLLRDDLMRRLEDQNTQLAQLQRDSEEERHLITELESEITYNRTLIRLHQEESLGAKKENIDKFHEAARLAKLSRNIALVLPTVVEIGWVSKFYDVSQHPYYVIGADLLATIAFALPFEISRRREQKKELQIARDAKALVTQEDGLDEPEWLKNYPDI